MSRPDHPTPQRGPWEPSAWLRDLLARRQAEVDALGVTDLTVIGSAAGWSQRIAGTREDRTCDRCRVYVPPGIDLYGGVVESMRRDGLRLYCTLGLCRTCAQREGVLTP